MLQEENVDIWDVYGDGSWIAILTNGIVKKSGEAVMGRGIAKECAIKFPEFPAKFGSVLKRLGNCLLAWSDYEIFTFPTKYDWKDPSDELIISRSCRQLKEHLNDHPEITKVYLPRPGCGEGGLDYESQVRPIMEKYFGNDERVVIVHNEDQ